MVNLKRLTSILAVVLALALVFAVAPSVAQADDGLPEHSVFIGDTAVSIGYLIAHPADAEALINSLITDQGLTMEDIWFRINDDPVANIATSDEATPNQEAAILDALAWIIGDDGEEEPIEPEPEDLVIVDAEQVVREVEFCTAFGDLNLQSTVTVELDDASTINVSVVWLEGPYDCTTPDDYELEGTLVDLPEGVSNPDDVTATAIVTVLEENEVILDEETVYDQDGFVSAINRQVPRITLGASFTLTVPQLRITYDLELLNFAGYSLTIDWGASLIFEGDGTLVTSFDPEAGTQALGDGMGALMAPDPYAGSIRTAGDSITFANLGLDVTFKDWYQVQSSWATRNLTIENCAFYRTPMFISNVNITDTTFYVKAHIGSNDAVLQNITLRPHPLTDENGILYVFGDADITNLHFDGGFTGMYVGKSLKYRETYRPAEPTLHDVTVTSTKYEQSWIALQHEKAILHTSGVFDISDEEQGLVLLGTGLLHGHDATVFEGDDVYFGWQTGDFVDNNWNAMKELYPEPYEFAQGVPAPPIGVDDQAAYKGACRLTVHGHTFNTEVYTFDNVMFGNVTLNETAFMWSDFTIVDNKTVVFDEIELQCGKERHILAATTGTSFGTPPPECDKRRIGDTLKGIFFPRGIKGTLTGGTITTDTKEDNHLVLGDGLLVEDVLLHQYLYQVTVLSATLRDVDIEVGDFKPWLSGVTVWKHSHATFEDVMWTAATNVEVCSEYDGYNQAKLTLLGEINNHGVTTLKNFAAINLASDDILNDPRDYISVDVSTQGGQGWVDVVARSYTHWNFGEGWTLGFKVTADLEIESTCYEIVVYKPYPHELLREVYDLRDLPAFSDTMGTEVKDDVIDRGDNTWFFVFRNLPGMPVETMNDAEGNSYTIRIRAADDREFNLDVAVWGINECTQQQILFDQDDEDLILTPKIDCPPEE